MSPPAPARAPKHFGWQKNNIFCNVNGLPKRRLAITNRGRAIAIHLAVYSPIRGNPGYFLPSGRYFAEFGRKRRRKRQSHAVASAPFHFSVSTATLNSTKFTTSPVVTVNRQEFRGTPQGKG